LNVAYEDIRQVAHPSLRHRWCSLRGGVEGVNSDTVIDEVIKHVEEE